MACCGFTSARTLIRWSITCLAFVSVTTIRPCSPRTQHHCNRRPHCCHRCGHRRLPASDREDGFTKLMFYSFECNIQAHVRVTFMRPGPVWLDSEICSLHLQFHCVGKLFAGCVMIGNNLDELSGRQVPTSMLRSHG